MEYVTLEDGQSAFDCSSKGKCDPKQISIISRMPLNLTILPYFGSLEHAVILMRLLCKETNKMWSDNKEKYVDYWRNTAVKKRQTTSLCDVDPTQAQESSPEKINIADKIVSCVMEN